MPIKPELRRKLYNTRAWRLQRERVLDRAGRRCECHGECGKDHAGAGGRCRERHMYNGRGDGVKKGGKVIVGPAHLNQNTGELVADEKLAAWCTGCHLRFDQEQHLASRHTNRLAELERRGQRRLL